MSAQSLLRDSSCAQNTAHKSLPTQKNTKLYGRHRTPYNLVFIWCFNLQNGQLRKVTIHIFESHKSPQYGTFQHFALLYGGNQLLLEKDDIMTMAGLILASDQGSRFVIITTDANQQIEPIHHRMPVLLKPEQLSAYLFDTASAIDMLKPFNGPLQLSALSPEQLSLFD